MSTIDDLAEDIATYTGAANEDLAVAYVHCQHAVEALADKAQDANGAQASKESVAAKAIFGAYEDITGDIAQMLKMLNEQVAMLVKTAQ